MRVVVVGSGVAGLTAARALQSDGHEVIVLDKGRRPGGRLATVELQGGGRADHGAQFFTARSERFSSAVTGWIGAGIVHEWCRGFGEQDGHPRYTATGGMARLAAHMASGLDVRQSLHVGSIAPQRGGGWSARWAAARGNPPGELSADAVIVTAPVPQSQALLGDAAQLPIVAYEPTISLMLALDRSAAIPPPGGLQLPDHPTWSWIADNVAKGTSASPSVTFHSSAALARARPDEEPSQLLGELLGHASPWLGDAGILDAQLHRWRYATPTDIRPEPTMVLAGGTLALAGDAFAGPRVEGAFMSGLAASEAIAEL